MAGLAVLLGVQVLVLRPRLDRRAAQLLAGQTTPPSHQHLAYIGLEAVKVLALPALGVVAATRVLR